MPNPLSQTNREQQFNSSNDIYQLKRLNCEAVLGEYQAGSQLSLEGQRAKRLSLLLLKGEALLIQNPSPDLTPPQQKNSDIPPPRHTRPPICLTRLPSPPQPDAHPVKTGAVV